MTEPRVGDIWQWMDREPVMLLRLCERGTFSKDSTLFEALELTTGRLTPMVFANSIMERWRQLA